MLHSRWLGFAAEARGREKDESFRLFSPVASAQSAGVKLFYTGPVINTEMLVMMLEKHGIIASQEFADPVEPVDEDDLNRLAKVFVPEEEYDRAYNLFYAEKEGEL